MIKILVCIKRVVDFNIKVRVKADHSGIETTNVKMSINPFDEIALEEAIRLKEQGLAKETLALSIGPDECHEILRFALAMGIDKALHIKTNEQYEPINIAKIIQAIVIKESPDLVMLGKQAIDDDCNQTGQMLAALLRWPQATFASRLNFNDTLRVTREVDSGLEIVEMTTPAVVTTDLRLNKPRYISLPNIMKAKQKMIEQILVESLSLDLSPHTLIKEVSAPSQKKPGIIVNTIAELVSKLHEEAKVI